MSTVVVLDYGSSNLRSVAKALEFVSDQRKIIVSDQPEQVLAADRVVFPGQGAMGQCMKSLRDKGLDDAIQECVRDKPFLGICLGLQSLMVDSDEDGGTSGLGVIPGSVKRFLQPKSIRPDALLEPGIPAKTPSPLGRN